MFYTQQEKLKIVTDLEVRAAALRSAISWGHDLSDQKASIAEMRKGLDSLEDIVNQDMKHKN